jgi:hypothetical protein
MRSRRKTRQERHDAVMKTISGCGMKGRDLLLEKRKGIGSK